MTLKSLIFRDEFRLQVDYDELITRLEKADKSFIKGKIGKEESYFFYFANLPIKKLNLASLPMTDIEILKPKNDQNVVKIKFQILNFVLVVFGAAAFFIWMAFLINIPGIRKKDEGFFIPAIVSAVIYCFVQVMYLAEYSNCKSELRQIEKELQSNALNK